jgi:metallo-beta-lactamase class B
MRYLTWRRALLALVVVLVVVLGRQWKLAGARGGQQYAEPFRIAGNLYYVGANDATSFLLTGPGGHVLIDGGYPASVDLVTASIAALGFDVRDVRVLLNTDPHGDHAGALAALKEASGAEVWASAWSAGTLGSGGDDPDIAWPMRALLRSRILGYPGVRVDHVFEDGDTIRVGPIALTAHVTGGHTRGCTSWSFAVREGERDLDVVALCALGMMELSQYPGQREDFDRTFEVLRGLPVDIWVAEHARYWDRYPKFVAHQTAEDPVAPFIDPEGYRAFLDAAETDIRNGRMY